jgi:phage replication-related protein YjqB (UPF0714/DUF867 family)
VSFLDLLRTPGVEEVLELGSTFGLLAFHGGLEGGTVEVAVAAAAQSGASLYMVIQPADLRWHVPSHRVGAEASPALTRFLDHVDVAIALHGYGRHGRPVDLLLGGGNRALAATLARHLRDALPGYHVLDDLDRVPPEMRGLHASNPVNQPARGGVQLELPPRVRGAWPATPDAPARPPTPHPGIVAALVATIEDYAVLPGASVSPDTSTSNVPPVRQ